MDFTWLEFTHGGSIIPAAAVIPRRAGTITKLAEILGVRPGRQTAAREPHRRGRNRRLIFRSARLDRSDLGTTMVKLVKTLTLSAAKAKFSEVIDEVAGGEDVIVTRLGKPIARISRFDRTPAGGRLGFMAGQGWMASDFDDWPAAEAEPFGMTD